MKCNFSPSYEIMHDRTTNRPKDGLFGGGVGNRVFNCNNAEKSN